MINQQPVTSNLVAICTDDTIRADQKIAKLVARLQLAGCDVVGVLQEPLMQQAQACNARLKSIANDAYYDISQKLGSGSSSCNLNTEVLEQAAYDISHGIDENTPLVVVNRFGKREARGGGFRCVFERALALDVPVLTIVQTQWVGNWLSYGGPSVGIINNDNDTINQWAQRIHISVNAAAVDRKPSHRDVHQTTAVG